LVTNDAVISLLQVEYYGQITWLLLLNINLPLLLFYRFHSSVCLADAWHSAYTWPCHSSDGHDGGNPLGRGAVSNTRANSSSTDAQMAGVSTLVKAYSMPHLTPPRTARSSHSHRASNGLGYDNNRFRLPHIDDVEDVEDIEHDMQSVYVSRDDAHFDVVLENCRSLGVG
jgi:hypothetical protein